MNAADAAKIAEPWLAAWDREIAALRQHGNPAEVGTALDRIERWRSDHVALALGFDSMIGLLETGGRVTVSRTPGPTRLQLIQQDLNPEVQPGPAPGVSYGAAGWARSYFAAQPDLDSSPQTPLATARLVGQLTAVEQGADRWREVGRFDTFLQEEIGNLDPKVLATVRPAFARAWREVALAREAERRYAAALLALVAAAANPVTISTAGGYSPRSDDRTVGELLDAYWSARGSKDVVAPSRALRQTLGADTPIRAVKRTDARRFADLVERIPANATSRYPGLTLAQAVEAASRDKSPRLSPASASRYVTYASMIWNWALAEGDGLWADSNPFKGLAGDDTPRVNRRIFKDAELIKLFGYLSAEKRKDSALFWVPAIMLNGARLSEVCQLRTDDVREVDGIHYLDISLYDAKGNLDPMKSLKNDESARVAAIHPLTIKAGFAEFVSRRRQAGAERLFGDVKPLRSEINGVVKYDWGHYASRDLNAIVDVAVSDEAGLVVHSFRHTARTRAEQAGVQDPIIDAQCGWRQKSVGRRYGERDVSLLNKNMAKYSYGHLTL